MQKINTILKTHFQRDNWNIRKPADGQQKECYIAQSGDLTIFLKFDVPIAPLHRLGEIGVAPRVLASGKVDDQPYVIQEYIAGTYPDWQWFSHNLPLLATFIRRYHVDEELANMLAHGTRTDYHSHITADLNNLESQFQALPSAELHTSPIIEAFTLLKAQAQTLQPAKLVPVHADPNTKNMLLVDNALRMVDWDNVTLSDPMRDAGQLLWWYVARGQWNEFFAAYGLLLDEALIKRIHWWAARTSLAIALWHVAHSYECMPFLKDFVAAIHGEGNPHAVFR